MSLKSFLEAEALKLPAIADAVADECVFLRYAEDVNPDALTDAWLESGTSYIWKVGTLAVIDNNKCDYTWLFIGHEREPGKLEFIGCLHHADGENDDPGRCLRRYVECASEAFHVFDVDED